MEKQTMWEKLIEVVEAKKDLELELKEAKSVLSDVTKQNELLKKELLVQNYKNYDLDSKGRLDFQSYTFGIRNQIELLEAGIKKSEMIDFIIEKDKMEEFINSGEQND